MSADKAPEPPRRASITMYDPARDAYSTTTDDVLGREVLTSGSGPSQSQEPGREAAATLGLGPASRQGTPSGPVERASGLSAATSPSSERSFSKNRTERRDTRKAEPNLTSANYAAHFHCLDSRSNPDMTSSHPSSPRPADNVEHSQPGKPAANMENNGKANAEVKAKLESSQQGQTSPHAGQVSEAANGNSKAPHNRAETSQEHDTHVSSQNNPSEKSEERNPDQATRPKRKRLEERTQKNRKRAKAAPSAYSRRDDTISRPQPEAPRSPSPIRRSPSPDANPVRQRKRPGGGARVSAANLEAVRRRQEERERQQQEELRKGLHDRGVHDVVRQHYNAVPERGREWRKTDSKIKGLRSFNNWVKSTVIQKFSPDEEFLARYADNGWASQTAPPPEEEQKRLLVIDLGCGKGGDLFKWNQAPQPVDLYVGLDPAEISIDQARDRYMSMRNQRGRRRGNPLFHAEFYPKDCFGEWLGDVPIVQRVGIDANVGPGGSLMASRWGGGGFDVVVSMFTMHYAFENEEKARQMLSNVAGVLKKGGRFIGVGPNSDIISEKVAAFHEAKKAKESAAKENQGQAEEGEVPDIPDTPEWGNNIYRVRFPGDTPEDGVFRPPFGWKYSYFMEEAVEEIPEYVVPWEAFRALAEDYNLEMQFRKPFLKVWEDEKDDSVLGPLSERMGVRSRTDGSLLVSDEELEAASFYHAFCFYKV